MLLINYDDERLGVVLLRSARLRSFLSRDSSRFSIGLLPLLAVRRSSRGRDVGEPVSKVFCGVRLSISIAPWNGGAFATKYFWYRNALSGRKNGSKKASADPFATATKHQKKNPSRFQLGFERSKDGGELY